MQLGISDEEGKALIRIAQREQIEVSWHAELPWDFFFAVSKRLLIVQIKSQYSITGASSIVMIH